MSVAPTGYEVRDLMGRQLAYIMSTDRDAIRSAVIAGVNDWLDEVFCVPRDELRGHFLQQLQVNIHA
jgi:hypothetical protein